MAHPVTTRRRKGTLRRQVILSRAFLSTGSDGERVMSQPSPFVERDVPNVSASQLAKAAGVTVDTIMNWAAVGRIPKPRKIAGTVWRWTQAEAEQILGIAPTTTVEGGAA